MIELENIETKFKTTVESESFKKLVESFKKASDVYIIGNGGLNPEHLCDDMSRLMTKAGVEKYVHSLNSTTMITSLANDYAFNNLYSKWLETFQKRVGKNALVIGCSCSGRSKNILTGLYYAHENGADSFLISGQKADALADGVNEVCLDMEYFHSTEVLTMLLFYELIHQAGGVCPLIKEEITRKSISSTLSRQNEK